MTPLDLQRQHAEPISPLSPIALDRQRIVQSAAFRRLQYKTQVFVTGESDHYRSRLTHTLEVANLARVLAARLKLDVELAEVVALGHDLGHPPFGHAGERALDECMAGHGGFEHNAHALRVVEYLEHPYPDFRGLNLTRLVRECLAKHTTQFDQPGQHALQDGKPPPPEGRIAAMADRLAYALHDLQDGLYAGLIEIHQLSNLALWNRAGGAALNDIGAEWRGRLRPVIERLQELLVADVAARHAETGWIDVSPLLDAELQGLDQLLLARVYRHHRLVRMDSKAARVLKAVFAAYVAEPALMPARFAERVKSQGPERVAADYIAGMTDRYCLREHARLFDPQVEA